MEQRNDGPGQPGPRPSNLTRGDLGRGAARARGGPLSWGRFEYLWSAEPGPARLRSRAYDDRGLTQPDRVPWNAKGYQMNAVDEVPVTAR